MLLDTELEVAKEEWAKEALRELRNLWLENIYKNGENWVLKFGAILYGGRVSELKIAYSQEVTVSLSPAFDNDIVLTDLLAKTRLKHTQLMLLNTSPEGNLILGFGTQTLLDAIVYFRNNERLFLRSND